MTNIVDSFYHIRGLLYDYGTEYAGIYLALMITLILIVWYTHKNCEICNYVNYMIMLLLFLFVLGIGQYFTLSICRGDLDKAEFVMFPSFIAIVLGIIFIAVLFKSYKNRELFSGFSRVYIILVLLMLAEASVPLQITLSNFTVFQTNGMYPKEVREIGDLVGTETVIVPSELRPMLKVYNWGLNTPLDATSNNADADFTSFFTLAKDNNITYVVIKMGNTLGVTNEESIEAGAMSMGYNVVDIYGDYIVCRLEQ